MYGCLKERYGFVDVVFNNAMWRRSGLWTR